MTKIPLRRRMMGRLFRHGPGMITCKTFESFIADYLEGALPRGQRLRFETHLKICRGCRAYLAAFRKSLELGSKAYKKAPDSVPDEVPEDLITAVIETLADEAGGGHVD